MKYSIIGIKTMKKLYIFDFDGTLLNTIVDSMECFNNVLGSYGLPRYHVDDYSNLVYDDFLRFLDDLHKKHSEISVSDFFLKFDTEYNKLEKPNTHVYDGVYQMLDGLKAKNIDLAICSNKYEPNLIDLVDEFFKDYEFIDISGSVVEKPDKPDPYRLNEIINNSSYNRDEVLYIGDKNTDILTAKNADLDMLLVTWGQSTEKDYLSDYPLKFVKNPIEIANLNI